VKSSRNDGSFGRALAKVMSAFAMANQPLRSRRLY
jgi:hypothetical protein